MKKVITYGTYDLLHHGHIRLLERAKALGDYLIVGVTSGDFDKKRGKINVQQSLMDRVKAVKELGIADEIIIEEYEGQKIEDIIKYGIDIFTVGSDWEGYFDYLNEYCDVVYLPRTKGISSTEIRNGSNLLKLGIFGDASLGNKIIKEVNLVNGICVSSIYDPNSEYSEQTIKKVNSYDELLNDVDAVYLANEFEDHYDCIKKALNMGKHVLCEPPIALDETKAEELFNISKEKNCILMEMLKTAYSTAYSRMLLLIKTGVIGEVKAIDATCTSLKEINSEFIAKNKNSMCVWGPTVLLPVFQILGTKYKNKNIVSWCSDENKDFDLFTKIDFIYNEAVATLKIGQGVKSEGELIITGTKGYVIVPAPWWKMDYFEIRYEDQNENKRYFYKLDGEGIRNELVSFVRSIKEKNNFTSINKDTSLGFCEVIDDYYKNGIKIK